MLKGEMDSPEVAASISPLSHQQQGLDDYDGDGDIHQGGDVYSDDYYSLAGVEGGGSFKSRLRSLSNEELEAELEGVSDNIH